MSIWVTSLLSMAEVLKMVLEKYQVESDHDNYGLFLVKDMGERRQITEKEFPLLLRYLICNIYYGNTGCGVFK